MASTSSPPVANQLVQTPRRRLATTERDKISRKLSKLTTYPNGSTKFGTVKINCDPDNFYEVKVTRMIDDTETTWRIRNKSVEWKMVQNQVETKKTTNMPGTKNQILGALIDKYFSIPGQKHYKMEILGKLPRLDMKHEIRISNIDVRLKTSNGLSLGLKSFLSKIYRENFFSINFDFEVMPNPRGFKQRGLINVLPSQVKINMPNTDLGVIRSVNVQSVEFRFKDCVYTGEPLKELAEWLIRHRKIGYRLKLAVADVHASNVIEDICEDDSWEFIPNRETLMAIFHYRNKNMIFTFDANDKTFLMEVVGRDDPRCAITTVQNVKAINTEISEKTFGERKEMEKQYLWEPCVPYHLSEMEVDFEKCVIICEDYEMEMADIDETFAKFRTIFSNPKTIVGKLKIIGYHGDMTKECMGINVDKLTLIHNQAYPSGLHLMFSRLMKLYVFTEEILDNNPMLIFIAKRYFRIQSNGNAVQLKYDH